MTLKGPDRFGVKRWSDLMGRDQELKTLNGFMDEAMKGNGATVLIEGEAGIGKSRLISEMRDYAEEISSKVKYYELASDKNFQKEYINSLYFPHADLSKYPETVDLLRKYGHSLGGHLI